MLIYDEPPSTLDFHFNLRRCVKAGAEVPLVAALRDYTDAAALRATCAAVRSLCTGDDPREPASGAFTHARVGAGTMLKPSAAVGNSRY
jgi:hypothetical protein